MFYLQDTDNNGSVAYGPRYRPSMHASTARKDALAYAAAKEQPVWVVTDTRTVMVAHPDGRVGPPPEALVPERALCTAASGRTCFCPPCRAERRDDG